MELSNKIRNFRFENDEMTQKQLAQLVGVSRQTMNAIENCKHAPTIDVAIRVADVFGVSVGQMSEYDYEGKPERRPIETTGEPAQPTHIAEPVLNVPAKHADPDGPGYAGKPGGATEKGEHDFSLRDLRDLIG